MGYGEREKIGVTVDGKREIIGMTGGKREGEVKEERGWGSRCERSRGMNVNSVN